MTPLLDAALDYAARGWLVFPLHGITDSNRCTCGSKACSNPGKHPRTLDGFKSATVHPDRITRWWTDYPDSNIGIATGNGSGLVVIDADSEEATAGWTAGGDEYWSTQCAKTSRGHHFYYQHPGVPVPCKVGWRPGLDIRADGGYVVAPPSRHVSGNDYEWRGEAALLPLPAPVLETAVVPSVRPSITAPIAEGGRNATMTRHVGVLFAKGHSAEEVMALATGLNETQCQPPLPRHELERIVRNIAQREWNKRPDLGTLSHASMAAGVAADALADMDIDYRQFPGWFSPALQQAIGPSLPGTMTVIGARPGAGKSTLLLNQARYLAEGKHRVLYAGMEMPPAMLLRSMAAQALGYSQDAVLANHWSALPATARGELADWIAGYQQGIGAHLTFIPDPQITVDGLRSWMRAGATDGYRIVMVDHLHEMDWGEEPTLAMSRGVRDMLTEAKALGVTLLVAAQLKRGMYDVLEDYMVPPQSAIKQCGAVEEVASVIAMLHRSLKPSATAAEFERVRRGQLDVREVADDGTMSVHIAKHRTRPGARDQSIKLYVHRGRLYDTREQRDTQLWGTE